LIYKLRRTGHAAAHCVPALLQNSSQDRFSSPAVKTPT
jgi:hypothetical protein